MRWERSKPLWTTVALAALMVVPIAALFGVPALAAPATPAGTPAAAAAAPSAPTVAAGTAPGTSQNPAIPPGAQPMLGGSADVATATCNNLGTPQCGPSGPGLWFNVRVHPAGVGDLLILAVSPHDAGPSFGYGINIGPMDVQTTGGSSSSWAEMPSDLYYYATGGSYPPYTYNLDVFFATVTSVPSGNQTITVRVDSASAVGGNGAWAGSASAILFDYQDAVLCSYADANGTTPTTGLTVPPATDTSSPSGLAACTVPETILNIASGYVGDVFTPVVQTPQFTCINVPSSNSCPGLADSVGPNSVTFADAYSTAAGGGTYNPELNITGYTGTPYWAQYTIALQYCATCNYTATFNETGLPVGSTWDVTLNGVTISSTVGVNTAGVLTGTVITFYGLCDNASYAYNISTPSGWAASPSSGFVTVGTSLPPGGEVYQPITFVSTCVDTATFDETGLTANGLGFGWSITLTPSSGGPSVTLSSTTTSLTFTGLCPGVYNWSITSQSAAYVANPSAGTVVVPFNGPNAMGEGYVGIVFSESYCTYSVVFWESGLPVKAKWAVSVDGIVKAGKVTALGGSITFKIDKCGTYTYTATSPGQVVPYPTLPGSITLAPYDKGFNTGVVYQVIFFATPSTVTHTGCNDTITFDESGLTANGLSYGWGITVNNSNTSAMQVSHTTSLTFDNLCPGNYTWKLSYQSAAYVANPTSGVVSVPFSGPHAMGEGYVGIVFSESYCSYTVTFWESGLPVKAKWTVTFDNMTKSGAVTSLGGSISFKVTSCGTYSFTSSSPGEVVPYPILPGTITLTPYDKGFNTGDVYQVVFFV